MGKVARELYAPGPAIKPGGIKPNTGWANRRNTICKTSTHALANSSAQTKARVVWSLLLDGPIPGPAGSTGVGNSAFAQGSSTSQTAWHHAWPPPPPRQPMSVPPPPPSHPPPLPTTPPPPLPSSPYVPPPPPIWPPLPPPTPACPTPPPLPLNTPPPLSMTSSSHPIHPAALEDAVSVLNPTRSSSKGDPLQAKLGSKSAGGRGKVPQGDQGLDGCTRQAPKSQDTRQLVDQGTHAVSDLNARTPSTGTESAAGAAAALAVPGRRVTRAAAKAAAAAEAAAAAAAVAAAAAQEVRGAGSDESVSAAGTSAGRLLSVQGPATYANTASTNTDISAGSTSGHMPAGDHASSEQGEAEAGHPQALLDAREGTGVAADSRGRAKDKGRQRSRQQQAACSDDTPVLEPPEAAAHAAAHAGGPSLERSQLPVPPELAAPAVHVSALSASATVRCLSRSTLRLGANTVADIEGGAGGVQGQEGHGGSEEEAAGGREESRSDLGQQQGTRRAHLGAGCNDAQTCSSFDSDGCRDGQGGSSRGGSEHDRTQDRQFSVVPHRLGDDESREVRDQYPARPRNAPIYLIDSSHSQGASSQSDHGRGRDVDRSRARRAPSPPDRLLVPDTNVLLHCRALMSDWLALAGRVREAWEGVRLLVPQAVLKELDGLKNNPLLGKAARDASRLLEEAQGLSVDGGMPLLRLQRDGEEVVHTHRHEERGSLPPGYGYDHCVPYPAPPPHPPSAAAWHQCVAAVRSLAVDAMGGGGGMVGQHRRRGARGAAARAAAQHTLDMLQHQLQRLGLGPSSLMPPGRHEYDYRRHYAPPPPPPRLTGDDAILACVRFFHERGSHALLVTNDRILRLRAADRGLDVGDAADMARAVGCGRTWWGAHG